MPPNQEIDWLAVGDYVRSGVRGQELPSHVWVGPGRLADAVAISGMPGFLVSERLRIVLARPAGDAVEFKPCTINAAQFWIMRIAVELAVIDVPASDIEWMAAGPLRSFNFPVWKRDLLDEASIFRIVESKSHMFFTDAVASAYLTSGCTGLFLSGPTGEAR